MKLFEILVPDIADFHQGWDEKVIEFAGGLTILTKTKVKWHSEVEYVVVVRIACTDDQMHAIAEMTRRHYNQYAVMYYVVSPEVHIVSVA